ncbi:MAG: hypothetical protein K6E60_10020 [Saccharofermentans sp.]|nr:hypothetical protein [Saccharofermentans sp.]
MKNKKGSVTIESSICFTGVLILLACIISALNLYRTDILMTRAVNQSCENISLLYPLTVPAGDAASVLLNAFPDTGIEGTKAGSVLGTIAKVAGGYESISGHRLEEKVLDGVLAGTVAKNITKYFKERNGGSSFFCPDDIDVRFDISSKRHIIEVTVDYSVLTVAGRKHRTVYSVIPLYGDSSLILSGDENGNDTGDIWSLNNFSRGDGFRKIYGTNLPKTFPVIDSNDNGNVNSLKSIDLTAPYYKSKSKITKSIKTDIDKLSSFNGTDKVINGKEYSVKNIKGKTLTVVIPGNSPADRKNTVKSLTEYAKGKGVNLVIKEYGRSTKYA